jgi:hypothetical protein
VDFCAFKWRDVQSALHAIESITEKYIFISSDSVYNNFVYRSKVPIAEEDFDLEAEYVKIKQSSRKGMDRYGYV